MAAEEIAFHAVLPIAAGLVIGIIEAYFVYEDENMTSGKDFLGDMWHGLLFAVVGVFIASNVPWVISQGWVPDFLTNLLMVDATGKSIVISVIITLIMMVKMVASHAIKGVSGAGFREKFWHKAVISAAIGFAPYYIFPLYASGFMAGLAKAVPWLPF